MTASTNPSNGPAEHHVILAEALELPFGPLKRSRELGDAAFISNTSRPLMSLDCRYDGGYNLR